MPADPYPGTPAPNTLADASKLRSQLDTLFADVTRRGKTNIATDQSTASTTYTTLATPDTVSSVVLPTDGLLVVAYQAMFRGDGTSNGIAAFFIGSNQLKITPAAGGAPAVQEVATSPTAQRHTPLVTHAGGLSSTAVSSDVGNPVTTGQAIGYLTPGVGGPCYIFAAAGTYDVSVKFKCTSGSMAAWNRRLWVWTLAF